MIYSNTKKITQFLGTVLLFSSCKTVSVNYNQEIPASVTIDREKDTVVVMDFTNDVDNVADNFRIRLQNKGFKTMFAQNYYEYRKDPKVKTNFVTLTGNVLKVVSPPQLTEVKGEQCAVSFDLPVYMITYTSRLSVGMTAVLNFAGTKEGPYSTSIYGNGMSQISWTECGRLQYNRNAPRPTPNVADATIQAVNNLGNEFDKIIDQYWRNLSVELFKGKAAYNPALNAGNSLFAVGDLKGAVQQYKTAIKQSQSNPKTPKEDLANCYYNLGIAQGYQGDQEAFANIDKAYSINPNPTYLFGRNQVNQFFKINSEIKK